MKDRVSIEKIKGRSPRTLFSCDHQRLQKILGIEQRHYHHDVYRLGDETRGIAGSPLYEITSADMA